MGSIMTLLPLRSSHLYNLNYERSVNFVEGERLMRWVIIGAGVLLLLVGAVWFLQGINVLPGSFMSGQSFWALMGIIFIAAGVFVGRFGLNRKPPTPQA